MQMWTTYDIGHQRHTVRAEHVQVGMERMKLSGNVSPQISVAHEYVSCPRSNSKVTCENCLFSTFQLAMAGALHKGVRNVG